MNQQPRHKEAMPLASQLEAGQALIADDEVDLARLAAQASAVVADQDG